MIHHYTIVAYSSHFGEEDIELGWCKEAEDEIRLLCMGIVVWASPPWISRLAIPMACIWLLLLGLRMWIWNRSRWNMEWRRHLWRTISGRWGTIPRHCRLLRWLIVRCLWPRICLLLWIGSLILMSYWRVVVVSNCIFIILEIEARHFSLHIFSYFPTLDVSGHDKITALLLYICDCILLKKGSSFINSFLC